MFSPENVKDCCLACLKTVPVMSQASDRLRREQTGSIWSKFHKEKEKESHRWRKRCRDRLGLCLLLFCWITPSSEDWTHNSCSSRCSVMGQDPRRREIWKWRRARGGMYVWEKWRERDEVNGENGECLCYGSLLNQRWPQQTWWRELLLGCFKWWSESGSGPVFPLHTYIHTTSSFGITVQTCLWKTLPGLITAGLSTYSISEKTCMRSAFSPNHVRLQRPLKRIFIDWPFMF